ncbi:jg15593 [Pararge aegeria aegeria]|uniref:Jg15593 protein n=1 Tax=Pararge aegeria aegeria TaxID=348720 RepID=A0A8S4RSK5_9NEOP|nr:jg15593 [Pararge aegeria aegeria]
MPMPTLALKAFKLYVSGNTEAGRAFQTSAVRIRNVHEKRFEHVACMSTTYGCPFTASHCFAEEWCRRNKIMKLLSTLAKVYPAKNRQAGNLTSVF